MRKFIAILTKLIVILVVLLLALILTLPFTIAPIVKTVASVGGPKVLGVPVSIGDVKLSLLAGNLKVLQLKIGYPTGYSHKDALALESIEIELKLASLMSNTIIISKLAIDGPAIAYETKAGKSNFDIIMANTKKPSSTKKVSTTKEVKKSGVKVVIENFTLTNGKVAYASPITLGKSLTLPLPPIILRDIGKSSGGVSFVDAVTEVFNKILSVLAQTMSGLCKN